MRIRGIINGQLTSIEYHNVHQCNINGYDFSYEDLVSNQYIKHHWSEMFHLHALQQAFGETLPHILQANPTVENIPLYHTFPCELLGNVVAHAISQDLSSYAEPQPLSFTRIFPADKKTYDIEFHYPDICFTFDDTTCRYHNNLTETSHFATLRHVAQRYPELQRILHVYFQMDHTNTPDVYTLASVCDTLLMHDSNQEDWYTLTSRVYGLIEDATRLQIPLEAHHLLTALSSSTHEETTLFLA